MNLGPYLILDPQNSPSHWCYISLNNKNEIMYHTKAYGMDEDWQEEPMQEGLLYVYCPKENSPLCYAYENKTLYQLPLVQFAGQIKPNRVNKVFWDKNEIKFVLENRRARELLVDIAGYRIPAQGCDEPPVLPENEQVAPSMQSIHADDAKAYLWPKQCIRTQGPIDEASLEERVMCIWMENKQLHFQIRCAGSVETGILDDCCDGHLLQKLQDSESNILTNSDYQALSQAYLHLTPEQQYHLSTYSQNQNWPLSNKMTPDEQIKVCLAILRGSDLTKTELEDDEKREEYNNHIAHYCSCLTPGEAQLTGRSLLNPPMPMIADVILYSARLIAAAARALGDTTARVIHQPSQKSRVPIGEFKDETDGVASLLIQNVESQQHHELFQLLLTLNTDGLETLSIKQILSLNTQLEGIIQPATTHSEIAAVADDALAGLSAAEAIEQSIARTYLTERCQELQETLARHFQEKVSCLSIEIILETLGELHDIQENNRIAHFINLLRRLNQFGLLTGVHAQANFEAVTKNPGNVVVVLSILHEAGLLTGVHAQENFWAVTKNSGNVFVVLSILHEAGLLTGVHAQANFEAVVKHKKPHEVALALTRLHGEELLTQENREVVVQHEVPLTIAYALTTLHQAALLTKENLDAVVQHEDPVNIALALTTLHQAGLLKDEHAQTNLDAVVHHKDPVNIADALTTLHQAGLLTKENRKTVVDHKTPNHVANAFSVLHEANLIAGKHGQANFEAVVKHEKPQNVARALSILSQARLLTNEHGQANFKAVVEHEKTFEVAEALSILNQVRLLTDEHGQEYVNAVVQHEKPSEVAGALKTLLQAALLTQENREAVAKNKNPQELAWALTTLHQEELLTQENREAVAKNENPQELAWALTTLHQKELLTQENREAVAKNENPQEATNELINLIEPLGTINACFWQGGMFNSSNNLSTSDSSQQSTENKKPRK